MSGNFPLGRPLVRALIAVALLFSFDRALADCRQMTMRGSNILIGGPCANQVRPGTPTITFFGSGYRPDEAYLFEGHAGMVMQRLLLTKPFDDRAENGTFIYRHRFAFNRMDPSIDIDARMIQGGYPIADGVQIINSLGAQRIPTDVVVVLVKRVGNTPACGEGLSFNHKLLSRRYFTGNHQFIDENNGKAAYEQMIGHPVAAADWHRLWSQLENGLGIAVMGMDVEDPRCQQAANNDHGSRYADFHRVLGTAVHEIGHAFAALEDEYTSPGPGGFGVDPNRQGFQAPNVVALSAVQAQDRANYPWHDLIPNGTRLPSAPGGDPATIGGYQGAAYHSTGNYRSQQYCVMNQHDQRVPFCAACSQAIRVGLRERFGIRNPAIVDPVPDAQPVQPITPPNVRILQPPRFFTVPRPFPGFSPFTPGK